LKIGDLVWCVVDFYKLPEQGVIIKVIEFNPVYRTIDYHYEIFISGEVHTLHSEEIFENECEALNYQIKQIRGYEKI